jgi:hypothetical protein
VWIVATALLGLPPKDTFEPSEYPSQVHNYTFVLKDFQGFITGGVTVGATYHYIAKYAVEELLIGRNMREDLFTKCIYKNWMYRSYLPLASHTQFVEARVKEAKIVSVTERSKMLWSTECLCH